VLDGRVGTGEEQRFVAVDAPADQEWWRTILAADVDDLTPPLGGTDVIAPDDDPVTDSSLHGDHLLELLEVRRLPPLFYPLPSRAITAGAVFAVRTRAHLRCLGSQPSERPRTLVVTHPETAPDVDGRARRQLAERAVDRGLHAARSRVEQRVREFLDAGFQLIDERGSASFTLQELLDRTNQSIRGFYQCFASKDELLLALLEDSVHEQVEDLERCVDRETDPLARLRAFTIRLFEMCEPTERGQVSGRHDHRPVAEFAVQLGLVHPDPVEAAMKPVFELLLGLVEDADAARVIQVDDAAHAATLLQRVVMYHWLADRLVHDPRRRVSAEDTWRFCLRGLSGARGV
jgi:AcrR family transcriptional regulator